MYNFKFHQVRDLDYRDASKVNEAAYIYAKAFRGYPWREDWPHKVALKEVRSWKPMRGTHNASVLVLNNKRNRIIGLAVGHVYVPKEHSDEVNEKLTKLRAKKCYFFREVAVDPRFRRRKAAQALTDARFTQARKNGCTHVVGRTRSDNTAKIEQFLKDGFKEFHRETVVTGGKPSERIYFVKKIA